MKRLALAVVVLATIPLHGARADVPEYPNLVPAAPFDIQIGRPDSGSGNAIRFSVMSSNVGHHHLQLTARPLADPERAEARQCIRWQGRACLAEAPVGSFAFHAAHQHWHFEDYMLYELRRLLPDGSVDASAEGLVRTAGKISFCLIDVSRQGPAAPGDPFASTGFYHACLGALQGISAGWADVYGRSLPGQEIVVSGVDDGDYAIVITTDPDGRLFETETGDNTAFRRVRLSGGGTVATPI